MIIKANRQKHRTRPSSKYLVIKSNKTVKTRNNSLGQTKHKLKKTHKNHTKKTHKDHTKKTHKDRTKKTHKNHTKKTHKDHAKSPLIDKCDGKRVNFHIVLDLDNTIISSLSEKEYKQAKIDPAMKVVKVCDGAYYTAARPYLDEFLDYLFKHFKVSVWTAASEGYAKEIIDRFVIKNKKERKLEHFFFDKHCQDSMKTINKRCPKDLQYLFKKNIGFTADNTVIIDDLHEVISHNKDNVVDSLYFDSRTPNASKDSFLLHLIHDLKVLHKRICKLRKFIQKSKK